MLKNAQAAVKAFAKRSEQPVLDEKAGMPAPTPAPLAVAEVPAPVAAIPVAKEDKKEVEPAAEAADEKPKFNIRALFAPKKKPAETPAEAETVQTVDAFAAQTREPATKEPEQAADSPAPPAVAADATQAEATPADEVEKKKGLARIFSLKRKRAVDSAAPSTTESEPKAEAVPAAEEAVSATETPASGFPAAETPAPEAPTEAESKRASWKRLRLSYSGPPKDEAEAKLTRTPSRVVETTADALGAVNPEPTEEKKEKKFWVFGRKDEVTEPEAAKPVEGVAPAEAEVTETAAPAKPPVWKRFMSISKIPEPEPKKEAKDEDKPAETAPTTEAPTPATDAPAPATDASAPETPAAETPATAAIPETPVTEKKSYFTAFARKGSKAEVATDAAPDAAAVAKAEDAEPAAPAAESETSEKKGSLSRIFSGRRKPAAEVATPPEPATEQAVETPAAATEEGRVEELKDAAPSAETSDSGAKGLYRLFSGRRKAPKADASAPSVQAESVAAEAQEESKEECKCPTPKEEAPAAESSKAGLFRMFSGRKASADAGAETPKSEVDAAPTAEPAAESAVEPTAEVLKDEVKETPKDETPKVWKRLLSARKKPAASPDAEVPAPAADAAAKPAPVTDAAPAEPAEVKEEKAGLVTRLRSLVPSKEKEVATEPAPTEPAAESVEKTQKPGVMERVTSALSLTRVKSPTPAETAPAAEDSKPAEVTPATVAAEAVKEEAPAPEAVAPAVAAPAPAAELPKA